MTDSNDHGDDDRGRQARMRTASQDEFFEYYYPRLVRFLTAQASNTEWAEDVAADAVVIAMDNWDTLLVIERPDSWLFKVAVRMLRRREARAREQCYLDEDLASSGGDLLIAAACDNWVSDHLDLVAAMRSLPRRQCEVIALHYLADYSVAEIAEILGVDQGTVKSHLCRGRESLRRALSVPAAVSAPKGDMS